MLPNSEVRLFRAIDKAALVLLLMIRMDAPTGRNEIADILGINRQTAAAHLRSLAQIGLITRSSYHTGYILTQGGRQLILGQTQVPALVALPDPWSGKALPEAQALQALPPEALPDSEYSRPRSGQDHMILDGALIQDENADLRADRHDDSQESNPLDSCVEKGTKFCNQESNLTYKLDSCDDSKGTNFVPLKKKKLINLTTSSSLRSSARNFVPSAQPTVQELLDASPILFGKPGVIQYNLPAKLNPRAVLGWLAQAYTERSLLDSPAGLVYARLRDHCLPRSEYIQHAVNYLPDDFLIAVGLLPEPVPEPEQPSAEPVELPLDLPPALPADPSLTPAHLRAWDVVLSEMQHNLPEQAFEANLRDSRPLRWEAGCLIVSAPNTYARDWLASRLTSTISRLLVGILNQPVRVQFE